MDKQLLIDTLRDHGISEQKYLHKLLSSFMSMSEEQGRDITSITLNFQKSYFGEDSWIGQKGEVSNGIGDHVEYLTITEDDPLILDTIKNLAYPKINKRF